MISYLLQKNFSIVILKETKLISKKNKQKNLLMFRHNRLTTITAEPLQPLRRSKAGEAVRLISEIIIVVLV